jgi:thiamine pyrophosphokinase
MTKIYIYCLFEESSSGQRFGGVYSSIRAVHRDALRLANRGDSQVCMSCDGKKIDATLANLRNTLKGKYDVQVKYTTNRSIITVLKTRIKE